MLRDQRKHAPSPDMRRLHLRLHIADNQFRRADIGAQDVPDRVNSPPRVIDLDRLELQPFGIGIDRIDNPAGSRRKRSDIKVMRGCDRPADQHALMEHRHRKGHIRAVACPAVRVIVHDDIAIGQCLTPRVQRGQDVAHIAGDRAGLQRG